MLKAKIESDMKEAMRSGDILKLSTLRMLWAAIHNKEIEKRKKDVGLSDEEVLDVIQSEVKKRKDAAAEYAKAGRSDLKNKEEKELELLQTYLPPRLSKDELERIIAETIKEVGASSQKDFGQVMKTLQPRIKGKADGAVVAAVVKEKLENLG